MCPWFGGSWFGGGLLTMLMMVLFWGLVIWGGFILVRKLLQTSQDSKQEAAALDILKQRYAKGEISREEFEQMKKELLQ